MVCGCVLVMVFISMFVMVVFSRLLGMKVVISIRYFGMDLLSVSDMLIMFIV